MMTPQETAIIDAAIEVATFSRTHPYPVEETPEWFEFAEKLDVLATAINRVYPRFTVIPPQLHYKKSP